MRAVLLAKREDGKPSLRAVAAVLAFDAARRAGKAARSTWNIATSGEFICAVLLLSGAGSATAGVYVLVGLGWALVAGSVPLMAAGFVLLRGLASA